MNLNPTASFVKRIIVTPGARKIIESDGGGRGCGRAVARALVECPPYELVHAVEEGRIAVYFSPERSLVLILTAWQAWRGLAPSLIEALVESGTEFWAA